MASLGHVAVGMAVARWRAPDGVETGPLVAGMLLWSALSLLPDADVVVELGWFSPLLAHARWPRRLTNR